MLVCGIYFPITGREFKVVQTEIARRKGENSSPTSEEEKRICEKVCGLPYDKLWNKANTRLKK